MVYACAHVTLITGTESKTVVAQLVAVLDTLCDTKETARAQVLELVEQLVVRLEQQEAQCRQLQVENDELQRLRRQQERRHSEQEERIAELQQRLHQQNIIVKV
jgi:TolA-binding protein